MKQMLLALCAFCLFTACNNDKKDTGLGGNMFGDPNQNGNNRNNTNNNNNNTRQTGRWSKQLKDYVFNACLQEVGQVPQAREKCDCWVGKVEAKYPGINNTNQIAEEVANQLAIECMQQFGGDNNTGGFGDDGFHGFDGGGYAGDEGFDDGGDNDGYYNNDGGYNNNNNINNPGKRTTAWPAAQRQQWMMGCTTTAQQQSGLSQQQANAYCDCMTRKVEAQYSFTEATRMTVQDFSTPEWVNARTECQMNLGY